MADLSHINLNVDAEGTARVYFMDGHYEDVEGRLVFGQHTKPTLLQRLSTWASANPVKVAALSGALAGAIPEPLRKLIVTLLS